jgi:mannose-6-phosphate isomerase-like protein (cupin superfamily)
MGTAGVRVATRTASIAARVEFLLEQIPLLKRLIEEQDCLVAGKVDAAESCRRLFVANRINKLCQHLELDCIESLRGGHWLRDLNTVRALAESVLRENPVLQVRSLLHVVKSHAMPERYVLSRTRRQEARKGFGLHQGIRNDEGPSVVIAFTAPAHEQLWHAHTADEYTLVLDTQLAGRYIAGRTCELAAHDEELFRFWPHTYHTLANRGTGLGRTFTLKYPLGMSLWLPAPELTGAEPGRAEVRSARREPVGRHISIRRFHVNDSYHRYVINLATLTPQAQLRLSCHEDGYFYVLDGHVAAHRGAHEVTAATNDLIVVAPTRALRIRAGVQGARLYWASDLLYDPRIHNHRTQVASP